MRTKRILAFAMALLIAVTMLPSFVFASAPSGELDGKLKLKGTAEVGGTLSADYKKVTPEEMSDDYVTFQWARKTGKELEEVGTESTYNVSEEDLGSVIVLKITGIEEKGVTGSLTVESRTVAEEGKGISEEEADQEEGLENGEEIQPGEAELGAENDVEEPSQDVQVLGENDQTMDESSNTQDIEEPQQAEFPQEDNQYEVYDEEDPVIQEMEENEETLVIPEENEDSYNVENGTQETLTYSAEAVIEDGSELLDFGTIEDVNLENADAKYVTVKNTGTGVLNFEEISPEHFMVQDITESLEPGQEVTLWIQPREGLEPGSYLDTITYESEEGGNASFQATITVEESEEPIQTGVVADTDNLVFTELTERYDSVSETQKITLSNPGTEDQKIILPTSDYFDLTVGTEEESVIKAGSQLEIFVMPKIGLAAGEYSEELIFAVEGSETESVNVTASIKVSAAEENVTVDMTSIQFPEMTEGYEKAPDPQMVTLINKGSNSIVLVQPEAEFFEIGTLSAVEIDAGEEVSFSIQPKLGLEAGIYEDVVSVYDENSNELATISVQFKVVEKELVYKLTVDPEYLDFGSLEAGYENAPKAQKVTISNTGTGEINLVNPASDFFTVSELSQTKLKPGESAVFTIQPKLGLEVSEYLEVIQIDNDEDVYALVNAHFNVTEQTSTANVLKSIQKPSDITGLPNGTAKSVKGLKLPSTVVISTSEGSMKASVSWDVNGCGYDPQSSQAQNFTVKGKVTLPNGVENPNGISLITSVKVGVKGYTAKTASAADNKITGIDPNAGYTTESKITFTAIGAGMDNDQPGEGDTRYIPLNWAIVNTNGWQQAPYSATFRMSRSGTYTLTVVFNEQKYNGSNWVNTGAQDTKSVTFKVYDPAGQTVTPTPTVQNKNAVKTGDDTNVVPFVIALIVAVACVAGVVIYRKKK